MLMKEIKIKIPTPEDILPEEFRTHMVNAAKELLLAFKCVADYKLKKIEELEKKFAKKEKEVKKIDLQ